MNTTFTETLLLKIRQNYCKSTCILISFSEDVACEVLSVGKLWDKIELMYWLNGAGEGFLRMER